jgi:hypothetical protein
LVCPFASLIGVGAVASGSQRLLVKDTRYRVYTWTAAVLLGLAWLGYFLALRRPDVRVALEVVSVLALLAGGLRLRSLVRSGQVAPLTSGVLGRVLEPLTYAVRSPWVAGTKAWLLAMLVFQSLGRARFSGLEYGAVVSLLLALVTIRLLRRPAAPRFGSLERFGAQAPPVACPLGFGCPAATREAAPPETAAPAADKPYRGGHAASLSEGWDS